MDRLCRVYVARLVLAIPLNQAMFRADEAITATDLERYADEAVRVFLAGYATEKAVVRLAVDRLTNPDIGTRLFMSGNAVKYYLWHVSPSSAWRIEPNSQP